MGLVLSVAGLLALTAYAFLLALHASPCSTPAPPSGGSTLSEDVLVDCGTALLLSAHTWTSYQVPRLSDGESLAGEISANSSVSVFLLNTSQLRSLGPYPSAPPSGSFWACTNATDCNVSVRVPGSPGQYYLVVVDLQGQAEKLEWTRGLAMFYS